MKRGSSPTQLSPEPHRKVPTSEMETAPAQESLAAPAPPDFGEVERLGLPEWCRVPRRRAAKQPSQPSGLQPLPLANFFEQLPVQDTPGAKVTAPPSQARPTPITISTTNFSLTDCRSALQAAEIKNFNFNIKPNVATLNIKTKAEKDKAINALQAIEKLQFHTYTDKSDRDHVSVVHGLYYSSAAELAQALKDLGFHPKKVTAFKQSADVPPRYHVTLPKDDDIGSFKNIRIILDQRVRIYKYRSNNSFGTMCFRCQTFGHAATNCRRAPRCVKCTGAHLTSTCDREASAPVRCCNCGGPHAASYRQCPQRLAYVAAIKARQHQTQQTRQFVSNKTNGRGWSTVAGTPPNTSGPQPQGPMPFSHYGPPPHPSERYPPQYYPQPPTGPPPPPPIYAIKRNGRPHFPSLHPTGPINPTFTKVDEPPQSQHTNSRVPDTDIPSMEETINLLSLAGELRPLLRRSMKMHEKLIVVLRFLDERNAN